MGSLQWVIFSFSHIVFIQVNYKGVGNSCLNPVSLCPARHSHPFEVSMQMSRFKHQTFKCWVSILWYLKSPVYHYYFINILIFTFFYLANFCGRLYSFHKNEIYLNKTYLLTYLPTYLLINKNNISNKHDRTHAKHLNVLYHNRTQKQLQ